MRYTRIFFLHFQDAFENRGRSFVWFLLSLLNPLLVLLFWRGAFAENAQPLEGWSYNSIATYYLLLVVAGAFLQVHIEEDVARRDIHSGFLSQYLTKPFPYILMKFFTELPWRMIQGFFGIVMLIVFSFVFRNGLSLVHTAESLLASLLIIILALLISFVFKMIVGISALWITEYSGLQEMIGVVDIIFAGFVLPLALFPPFIKTIALFLPFAYMIYFPVVSLLGKLSSVESMQIIGIQLVWLIGLWIMYRKLWESGVKRFTGLGQ